MPRLIIGNERASDNGLALMQARGGTWAAYQNHDLGHPKLGHIVFLQVGPGCTFSAPPERAPDCDQWGMGWRYLLCGFVDLATGEIYEG